MDFQEMFDWNKLNLLERLISIDDGDTCLCVCVNVFIFSSRKKQNRSIVDEVEENWQSHFKMLCTAATAATEKKSFLSQLILVDTLRHVAIVTIWSATGKPRKKTHTHTLYLLALKLGALYSAIYLPYVSLIPSVAHIQCITQICTYICNIYAVDQAFFHTQPHWYT